MSGVSNCDQWVKPSVRTSHGPQSPSPPATPRYSRSTSSTVSRHAFDERLQRHRHRCCRRRLPPRRHRLYHYVGLSSFDISTLRNQLFVVPTAVSSIVFSVSAVSAVKGPHGQSTLLSKQSTTPRSPIPIDTSVAGAHKGQPLTLSRTPITDHERHRG